MASHDGQKKAIGLSFIIDTLCADSPFGIDKIKKIGFFKPKDKALLLDEFYNVSRALCLTREHADALNEMRRALMRFKNIKNILKKCEQSYLHEIELFEVKNFLLSVARLRTAFDAVNDIARFKDIAITDMTEALNVLDPEKKRIAPFSLSESYTPALWKIRKDKARLEGLIHGEKDAARLEALKLERLQVVVKEEEEETQIKKTLSRRLTPFLPLFYANIDNIGKLDFTVQKALLADKYGAVCPAISDEPRVTLHNMFNPEIAEILSRTGKNFTPISMSLSKGTTILTGANMGGKSVAIKTAVLNIILARMGFFVFAEKVEIPLFDGVCLISEDLQSIHKGLSTFGAEILRLNDIIHHMKTGFLFVALDEFARGTNPEEGAIIVKAVARFANAQSSVCLMTTHYDNVVETGFMHYQVAGLSDLDFSDISRKIAADAKNGVDLIAEHMDYRLLRVDGQKEPPRDALNICKLLSLDSEILNKIQEQYL